ncbi:coiled-coil domain-containing protein 13 isoform X2 [Ascaphus truei]|uniref:coiled-coil domain-containing protein 13 isoform X2 n=1 Tax=Ascaphus truei TaxID=8439 RepID=UPI003F59280E
MVTVALATRRLSTSPPPPCPGHNNPQHRAEPGRGHAEGSPGLIMESDEVVNENLRVQFRALQEQQERRLQRLRERKKEKHQEKIHKDESHSKTDTFGIQDELNLFEVQGEASNDVGKRLLEDENEQLQGQLREVKDENGRLYKLLQEKEFEVRHLRKRVEEGKLALAGTAGLAGDVAATKIVELSKRNRELTAEMESERTKVKQLNNKVKELEKEFQNTAAKLQSFAAKDSGSGQPVSRAGEGATTENAELRALQEKLSAANFKMTEYRNQIQSIKQELKIAHKVLANEVGEDVNISQLVTSSGSWRGRAQQILALQGRTRELENQLGQGRSTITELSLEEEMLGISVPKRFAAQEKNLFRIRTLEKERKEIVERTISEHDTLKKDHEELKKKLEASKTRNRVLSNDIKTMKTQIATQVDKGKHDDELIDALLSQQKSMQEVVSRLSQQDQKNKDSQHNIDLHLYSETQKHNSLIGQLKQMVAEREAKVKELENEIKQLTLKNHLKNLQSNGKCSDVQEATEALKPEELGPIRPLSSGADHAGRTGSVRTISKLGHELIEPAAAQASFGNISVSPRSSELRVLQAQNTEYRALCQATEVERDRLMELVTVLQKRSQESSEKVLNAEKKLQEERRRSVLLEQKLEKIQMDTAKNAGTHKVSARGKAGQSLTNARPLLNLSERRHLSLTQSSDVPLESQIEELNTKLAIQLDENEALKTALKSTLKTKEDDLRLYHEMMGEVKQIFLQALRQHKQERNLL